MDGLRRIWLRAMIVVLVDAGLLSGAPEGMAQGRGDRVRTPSGRVIALDEKGRLIQRSRFIWLAAGRAGVPATLYKRIGFWTETDAGRRQVQIAVPQTDVTVTFQAGRRKLLGQSANLRQALPPVSYPVARRRRGEFYLAASLVQSKFSDVLSTTWDHHRRTLTLRRVRKLPPVG